MSRKAVRRLDKLSFVCSMPLGTTSVDGVFDDVLVGSEDRYKGS